jgi:hypothetical protein
MSGLLWQAPFYRMPKPAMLGYFAAKVVKAALKGIFQSRTSAVFKFVFVTGLGPSQDEDFRTCMSVEAFLSIEHPLRTPPPAKPWARPTRTRVRTVHSFGPFTVSDMYD